MSHLKRFVQRFSWRDGALSVLPVLLACALSVWIAYRYIDPAPPKRIVIATGDEDSDYLEFAKSYQGLLAKDGIELVIQPSGGAMDNLQKLHNPAEQVDVAFMQDGLDESNRNLADDTDVDIVSLGSVTYEPIWIFYRGRTVLTRMSALAGKRIAVGGAGSGTHVLATRLLKASGVDAHNAHLVVAKHDAIQAMLVNGTVDAAFFIGAPDSALVESLAAQASIHIMNLDQADAYARHFPYLHHLVLPHGALNLAHNIPARDLHLLSTTTNVAVRETLHPALITLLMKAMKQTHDDPDLLNAAHEFPSAKDTELPISEVAEHFYKSGPPFLQRYLPFWLATLLDRAALVLIPILAVLIPIGKTAPKLYDWRIRRRIYRWYGELTYLEAQLRSLAPDAPHTDLLKQVDQIDEKVARAVFPVAFADHVYVLKEHIDFVRRKM